MHEVTLRMKQIKKSFSSVSVLKGVDLEARSGEVLAQGLHLFSRK